MKVPFNWGKGKKSVQTSTRRISASRIHSRRVKISGWAREAQKCDIAIAKIDAHLGQLSGGFTRARKELLEARRLEWTGRLNEALAHLKKEKSSMSNNIKHNQNITVKRTV